MHVKKRDCHSQLPLHFKHAYCNMLLTSNASFYQSKPQKGEMNEAFHSIRNVNICSLSRVQALYSFQSVRVCMFDVLLGFFLLLHRLSSCIWFYCAFFRSLSLSLCVSYIFAYIHFIKMETHHLAKEDDCLMGQWNAILFYSTCARWNAYTCTIQFFCWSLAHERNSTCSAAHIPNA